MTGAGAVALTGTDANLTCTIKATSSLSGAASATRNIAITKRTQNAVNCSIDVPRAGDTIQQSVSGKNNAFNMPRDLGTASAPNNPVIRAIPTVTATYNYATGVAGGTILTTQATGGNATIPLDRDNEGKTKTAVNAAGWLGYVPLPIPAALIKKPSANMVEAYDIDASGQITTPNYWQPAMTSKPNANNDLTPVLENYPADWQAQFASRVTGGTAVGASLGTAIPVTIRTLGGWLNGLDFRKLNGGMYGATYKNVYYNVTAKYEGRTTDVLTMVANKLEYTNMCKISYTFTRRSVVASPATGTNPDGVPKTTPGIVPPPLTGTYAGYVWTADIATQKADISASKDDVARGGTDGNGDWVGTFLTHDRLPRVFKDDLEASPLVAGVVLNNGANTVAQANPDYYENKNRAGAATNHTELHTSTTSVVRTTYLP